MKIPRVFVLTVKKTWHKWEATKDNLRQHGIESEPFLAIDRSVCRLAPILTFDVNKPGEKLGEGPLVACLSHYMCWKVLEYIEGDYWWVLEDDATLDAEWRGRWESSMEHLPDDWDIVFLGSCCAAGRGHRHVGGNLFDVRYPMCGHALMIRRKALPTLLEIHQKIWAPLDIAMKYDSLPRLRVYTILPRIFYQRDSFIPE